MSLNILIVDDSETVRSIIVKTLQIAGVPTREVFQAGNGKEALDILRAQWVDLVFSDINMPEMGGVELLEKMQQEDLLKSIPVIIVSTEGSATRIEAMKAQGVRAYIRKPFSPEQLRAVVMDIVGEVNGPNEKSPE